MLWIVYIIKFILCIKATTVCMSCMHNYSNTTLADHPICFYASPNALYLISQTGKLYDWFVTGCGKDTGKIQAVNSHADIDMIITHDNS